MTPASHPPDTATWAAALDRLLPHIHPVDAAAVRIWFAFHPLPLAETLARADDVTGLVRRLRLEGHYRLDGQSGDSQWFLYGHRYWSEVTTAVTSGSDASSWAGDAATLASRIHDLASAAAARTGASLPLLLGITAVAVMTRQQLAIAGREMGPETAPARPSSLRASADEVLAARARVPRSGILSLFRSTPVHRITFDERRPDGYFTALGRQELTSGAASDTRPYDLQGRLTHSGPIPTDCRSGTCGTCWVGVLGGAERLSPVEPNEAKRLRACGYSEPSEPTPLIRLACLAKASGPISIVVPPWNGVLGRYARPV